MVANIEHLSLVSEARKAKPLRDAVDRLVAALRLGGTVYVCGNGGSFSDAQHFAAELMGGFNMRARPGLPVVALGSNPASVTAIANDYGYEEVFAREYEAMVRADVHRAQPLVCLSTSGASPNLIRAASVANQSNNLTIALCPDSPLSLMADVHVHPGVEGVAMIQEEHIRQLHYIAGEVETEMFGDG